MSSNLKFFKKYDTLLHSPNYVTKRQSVKVSPHAKKTDKLLSEILLARENLPVMRKWIESLDNLMLMMNLLRDRSRNIQFEAFHVFKVHPLDPQLMQLFVANPRKSEQVEYILVKNRDKLMVFLQKFQSDRQGKSLFLEQNVDQMNNLQMKRISCYKNWRL
jgi:calcium binding protein 39